MPENEFEKKVAAELGGLKFKPSGEVWLKVEARIRKKKKQRIIIIIFLFAGLLLVGYWQKDNFFGYSNKAVAKYENQIPASNNSVEPKEKSENKTDNLIKEKQIKNVDGEIVQSDQQNETVADVSIKKTGNNISPISSEQNAVGTKQNDLPVYNKRIDPGYNKKNSRTGQKRENILPGKDVEVSSSSKETPVGSNANKPSELNTSRQEPTQILTSKEYNVDSAKQQDAVLKNVDQEKEFPGTDSVRRGDSISNKFDSVSKVILVDSPVVRLPQKSFDKKWKFGIEFTPGTSSFNESFLSLNSNKSADAFANPNSSSGGSSTLAGPVGGHSGFAFQLGGFSGRQISNRSSLILGLRYSYYSEKIHIGNIQSSVSTSLRQFLNAVGANQAYGAGGSTTRYTNKYHFIELPVMYKLRLSKNDKHPVSTLLGFKLGRMLASNAILYDTTAGGIYYNNKNLFKKSQFGLSGGIDWRVINSKNLRISIGPSLDLHLNSLYDNPHDSKKYILFLGLRTSILLDPKK